MCRTYTTFAVIVAASLSASNSSVTAVMRRRVAVYKTPQDRPICESQMASVTIVAMIGLLFSPLLSLSSKSSREGKLNRMKWVSTSEELISAATDLSFLSHTWCFPSSSPPPPPRTHSHGWMPSACETFSLRFLSRKSEDYIPTVALHFVQS